MKPGFELLETYHGDRMVARVRIIRVPGYVLWDRLYQRPPQRGDEFIARIEVPHDGSRITRVTQAACKGGRRYNYHGSYGDAMLGMQKWLQGRFTLRERAQTEG